MSQNNPVLPHMATVHGVLFFSWLFSFSENTWEPQDNLDCPDIISAFEAKRGKKEEPKKRKKEAEPTSAKKKKVL